MSNEDIYILTPHFNSPFEERLLLMRSKVVCMQAFVPDSKIIKAT